MRRNAEPRSIVRQIPVSDVFALIEQVDEPPQKKRYSFGHLPENILTCMNVVQVEDVRHEQMSDHLLAKKMSAILHAFTKAQHVGTAFLEILFGKFHYRVLKQRHMPDDAVVAA